MKTRRIIASVLLAVCLIMAGGASPVAASHNPTVSCWEMEHFYGDSGWAWYPDHGGWWYYEWWLHQEDCEDGWNEPRYWHQHWFGPYGA